MKKLTYITTLSLILVSSVISAATKPSDPAKQTVWDLYLTATEAAEMVTKDGSGILFVDVREPVEIMFTGYTDMIDVNVPYLLVNAAKWNLKKPVLAMEKNPDFARGVELALAKKGLDKTAPIILMCRSGGTRGAPSAKALEGMDFKNVYVVTDGFEGSSSKENPDSPWRTVNGWKNSGLPWSYKLNPNKIYLRRSE